MIRQLKYGTTLLVALILSGCAINSSQSPAPVEAGHGDQSSTAPTITSPTDNTNQVAIQPLPVPEPPKLLSINWTETVQPLLTRMQNTPNISSGSVLLVDRVKNSTNGHLQAETAIDTINSILINSGQFQLITAQQLAQAKQGLGISVNDSLNSRGKAIGIARNLNAQYVLYSSARGNIKQATLQMQLMTVETGEIIWSGSTPVIYSSN